MQTRTSSRQQNKQGTFTKSSYRSKLLKCQCSEVARFRTGKKNYFVLIHEFYSSKTLLELKAPKEKRPSAAAPGDVAAGSCAATVTPRGAKPHKHKPPSSRTQLTLYPPVGFSCRDRSYKSNLCLFSHLLYLTDLS